MRNIIAGKASRKRVTFRSHSFHLGMFQLNISGTVKYLDLHLYLLTVIINLFDHTLEAIERTECNLNRFAYLKLGKLLVDGILHLVSMRFTSSS